jgi:tetratricopeptide (TPR) repeat protein
LTAGGTTNSAAQDAFLRGLDLARANKNEPAIKDFDAAIAADPGFAKPYASRAGARTIIATGTLGGGALRAELAKAEVDARRAIELAPGWGRPFGALSLVLLSRLNLRGARDASDAAYKAASDDATVLRTRGNLLGQLGDDQAIALYQRAEALDPLRPRNAINRADMQYYLGRFDDAIASAQSGLARFPDDPRALNSLALALLAKGEPGEALKAAAPLPADSYPRLVIEAAAAATTDRASSDRALATLVAKYSDSAQYQIAEVHSWRREPDLAFAAIARAWDGLDPGLASLKTDPLLAPIRTDPRFGEWVRKIGFP